MKEVNKMSQKIKRTDEWKEEAIEKLVNRLYWYPSKFNLWGRMVAHLEGRLTPDELKRKMKHEEGLI